MKTDSDLINVVSQSAAVATDFSVWSLFMQASLTVKLVILALIACSLWSWTIIFAKTSLIKQLKFRASKFEKSFWSNDSISDFMHSLPTNVQDPFINIFLSGMNEWNRSKNNVTTFLEALALKDRMESMMRVSLNREIEKIESHIGFLATVGSTAPFVGLFGTVWGIMNSFESIGMDKNTSLTSVAPGIAEALFATALGLIVTIPAVIAYNKISSEINRYHSRADSFIDELSNFLITNIKYDQRGM